MAAFSIGPAEKFMPDGLQRLALDAEREDIRIVRTTIDQWRNGTNRFDRPGEALLAASSDEGVVGIAGLSICSDVDAALRVRRTYVAPGWRRRGVARALATQLVDLGLRHIDTITCNARASASAPPFWESIGFRPVDLPGITHVLGHGPE